MLECSLNCSWVLLGLVQRQETPTINPIDPADKPHRPSTKHYRKDASREVLGDFAVDSGSCHQVLFDLPVVLADDHSGWLL